jgi:hypothetical protein
MLIFDSKRGRFGTQKPKQWGPLSSVRAAVFRNAEALGIDADSVIGLWAMWEGAGLSRNVISGSELSAGDGVWANDGLLLTNTTYYDRSIDTEVNKLAGSGTFWAYVNPLELTGSTSQEFLFCARNDRYYLDITRGLPSVRISSESARSATVLGGILPDGVSFDSALTWDDSTYHGYYNGLSFYDGFSPSLTTPTSGNIGGYISDIGTNYIFNGIFHTGVIFASKLHPAQISQLHEAPYLLLQPNPTPLIFDFGAVLTPTISYPTDGSTGVSTSPTVSWSAVTGATAYQLDVATSTALLAADTPDVYTSDTITATSQEVTGLAANTEHFARVRANI